jgi:hypothetical protein
VNSFGPTWKCLVLATEKLLVYLKKNIPTSALLMVKTEAGVTAGLEVRSCGNGMTIYAANSTAFSLSCCTATMRKSSVLGLWSNGESNHFCGLVHKMWLTSCTVHRADS